MQLKTQGVCSTQTPFVTTILAPQLRARGLPLAFVAGAQELPSVEASFSIVEGEQITRLNFSEKQALQGYVRAQRISVALVISKSFQQKLTLLDLGFTHCIDIPVATEVIIKTIENGVRKSSEHLSSTKTILRDTTANYGAETKLTYLHDRQGRTFLTNQTRSAYLSLHEQRILEYLLQRAGYASKNELAYAGWKHFEIRANTIAATIKKLRQKLATLGFTLTINSLYGYGYSIRNAGTIPPETPSSFLELP